MKAITLTAVLLLAVAGCTQNKVEPVKTSQGGAITKEQEQSLLETVKRVEEARQKYNQEHNLGE